MKNHHLVAGEGFYEDLHPVLSGHGVGEGFALRFQGHVGDWLFRTDREGDWVERIKFFDDFHGGGVAPR